jgi:hypothetical protein
MFRTDFQRFEKVKCLFNAVALLFYRILAGDRS